MNEKQLHWALTQDWFVDYIEERDHDSKKTTYGIIVLDPYYGEREFWDYEELREWAGY